MLIKESQLIHKPDILNQLNEAVYLTQEEASLNLSEVPVVVKENGTNLVDYGYINTISEQNGIGLLECIELIKESNGIDNLTILVDEGDAISMQEAFDPDHMVVRPLSEDSDEVFWCDFVSEAYLNDEINEDVFVEAVLDEEESIAKMVSRHVNRNQRKFDKNMGAAQADFFNNMPTPDRFDNKDSMQIKYDIHQKQFEKQIHGIRDKSSKELNRIKAASERLKNYRQKKEEQDRKQQEVIRNLEQKQDELNKKYEEELNSESNHQNGGNNSSSLKYGAAAAGAGLAGYLAYKQYKNKPKSVIGKRIAALRKVYSKFMKRAQSAKDSGIANKLKKVAAKILSVIDKLLEFLQKKAG